MEKTVIKRRVNNITNVEVLKSSYTWTIKNFSFLSAKKIKSSAFTTGRYDENRWRLRMYPRCSLPDSSKHVSLFLQSLSPPQSGTVVKFSFSVILANGQQTVIASHKVRNFKERLSLGYHKFIDRKNLADEKTGLLHNDTLQIVCEISIGTGKITNQLPAESKEPKTEAKLLEDLQTLFKVRKFSDVTLIADGTRFRAHKAILSIRSPVFAAMLEDDAAMKKRRDEILIADVSREVLLELLRFVYTGRVENLKAEANGLLIAAEKYGLRELKDACERELSRNFLWRGLYWLRDCAVGIVKKFLY